MSRHDRSASAAPERASLYDAITDMIIGELEAGCVPWVRPWGTAAAKVPLAPIDAIINLDSAATF